MVGGTIVLMVGWLVQMVKMQKIYCRVTSRQHGHTLATFFCNFDKHILTASSAWRWLWFDSLTDCPNLAVGQAVGWQAKERRGREPRGFGALRPTPRGNLPNRDKRKTCVRLPTVPLGGLLPLKGEGMHQ